MIRKNIAVTLFCLAAFAAVCSFFYMNAENFIKYEPEATTSKAPENVTVTVNGIPEEIPDSDYYRMYLSDSFITVLDSNNTAVYRSQINDVSAFTEKDLYQLETDGIYYTVRSELVEVLNYIID